MGLLRLVISYRTKTSLGEPATYMLCYLFNYLSIHPVE